MDKIYERGITPCQNIGGETLLELAVDTGTERKESPETRLETIRTTW